MRVNSVDAPARINSDAAEFLEPLFAKARAFELVIVRAERPAFVIQSAGRWRRKSISEIESLICDQHLIVRRGSDVHDLTAENP